jgi:3-dehydroquinate dehydratase-1
VAASVAQAIVPDELARALALGVDVLELRADRLLELGVERSAAGGRRDWEELARVARWLGAEAPLLLTVRSRQEGGSFAGNEDERLAPYRELLPHAHAVDVELRAPIRDAVVSAAREADKPSIASFHDFERTPPLGELRELVETARSAGASVVKVATSVRDDEDIRTLAGLLLSTDMPMIAIGMGERGVKTRVFFPALGSLLTFAALGQGTAPGQLGLAAMAAELRRYYPGSLGRRPA